MKFKLRHPAWAHKKTAPKRRVSAVWGGEPRTLSCGQNKQSERMRTTPRIGCAGSAPPWLEEPGTEKEEEFLFTAGDLNLGGVKERGSLCLGHALKKTVLQKLSVFGGKSLQLRL